MATEHVPIILWNSEKEKCFIEVMVDEVNRGNMKDGLFRKNTWDSICKDLNCKINKNYSVKQLREKFQRLRIQHRSFRELLEQPGFSWNAETNTVKATEKTWQSYTQAQPKAAQFRKRGCEHFELLEILFNNSTGTKSLCSAPIQDLDPLNSFHKKDVHEDFLNTEMDIGIDLENLADSCNPLEVETSSTHGPHVCKRPKLGEKKKEMNTMSVKLSEAFTCFMEATKAMTNSYAGTEMYYKEKSFEGTSSATPSSNYSMAACLQVLDDMEDSVDDETYLTALDKFTNNVELREAFIKMPSRRRTAWLARINSKSGINSISSLGLSGKE